MKMKYFFICILSLPIIESKCDIMSSFSNLYSNAVDEVSTLYSHSNNFKDNLNHLYELITELEEYFITKAKEELEDIEEREKVLITSFKIRVNTMIFNYKNSSETDLLNLIHDVDKHDFDLFIQGMFISLASDTNSTICYTSLSEKLPQIEKTIEAVYYTIKDHKNIASFLDMYNLLTELRDYDTECYFSTLLKEFAYLITHYGKVKILYRLVKNYDNLYGNFTSSVNNFKQSLYKESGENFGFIIKALFNYSIK